MTIPLSSPHIESFAKNRAPFFTGTDYPDWKTKMTWYLQSTDLDVWDIIEDDPQIFLQNLLMESWFQNPSKNGMSLIEEIFN